jgi:hypothetical protein
MDPIDHRLFSQISRNWEAEPLDSYEEALKFIRTTATTTGLKVSSCLDTTYHPTGVKGSKRELAQLSIRQACPSKMELYDLAPKCEGVLGGRLAAIEVSGCRPLSA